MFVGTLHRALLHRLTYTSGQHKLRELWPICCLCLLPLATQAADPKVILTPRVLIVGGGPDLQNNQVAIESNVRYVNRLLPAESVRTTLFADGDPQHATVLFDDDPAKRTPGERVLDIALHADSNAGLDSGHYRRPDLGSQSDGASRPDDIARSFRKIGKEYSDGGNHRPLLLYFTGHGSADGQDHENNQYDLWGDGGLTVKQLAHHFDALPSDVPINVVMVQCFSGAFGNLLFENGDPHGRASDRDIAGFFATVNDRVAAGCTSAINEAEYHDFTSYFFAALSGRDRVGRQVSGADYDGNGQVGMDEAFCYTLLHDESIDVPVCTSDVFLRRFVPLSNEQVFRSPYSQIRSWAASAQRAALEGLSDQLHLHGEDRALRGFRQMQSGDDPELASAGNRVSRAQAHFNALSRDARQTLYRRFPRLHLSHSSQRRTAESQAAAELTREASSGDWKELFDAGAALDDAEAEQERCEIAESHRIRFVRLCKSIVLAHQLQRSGTSTLRARFARLQSAEARTLVPTADTITTKS